MYRDEPKTEYDYKTALRVILRAVLKRTENYEQNLCDPMTVITGLERIHLLVAVLGL